METETRNRLHDAHIDVEDALNRVGGNEALYIHLLKKFSQGQYFENILGPLESGDLVSAEHEMHKLKGVSGNLSMVELSQQCFAADDALKAGKRPSNLEQLKEAYDIALAAIRSLP